MAFFDRLRERIRATDGVLAVGLNPDVDRLPDDCREYDYPRRAFNRGVVDATHENAAAYTLNPAFYADAKGWTALAETVALARGRGVPVVLDGKWSDVPAGERGGATGSRVDLLDRVDAVTVSPYLGREALGPLLDADAGAPDGLGVFVTCRTPNRGAADLQDRQVARSDDAGNVPGDEADGDAETTLAERVAELVGGWADDADADVGLLVGGGNEALEALRARAPDLPFLAVGGARNDPDVAGHAVAEGGANDGVGLVETTREVLYAGETAARGRRRERDDYAAAARETARRLRRQLNRRR